MAVDLDVVAESGQQRYARQLALKGFGIAAQARLTNARVLIVGVGGLGAPAASYLAAAGVGTITLVDHDIVDESNLHRQLLFATSDVGRPKLDAAAARLRDLNPLIEIATHEGRFDSMNGVALARGHDVVVDCTDNFPARYAINDACLANGIPFVYGSVARFEGQVTVFASADGPCYRCLFPDPPAPGSVPTCAEEGVLGVVPGIVGLYQATETIKLLTGVGTTLAGTLLMLDLLSNETQYISIARRPLCPACGDTVSSTPPKRVSNEPVSFSPAVSQISPETLFALMASAAPPVIIDVRERWEYELAHVEPSVLIPLSELQARVSSLTTDADYVLLCHHGMRSEMAAQWLLAQGFSHVANLDGGIDRWSVVVDPSLARY